MNVQQQQRFGRLSPHTFHEEAVSAGLELEHPYSPAARSRRLPLGSADHGLSFDSSMSYLVGEDVLASAAESVGARRSVYDPNPAAYASATYHVPCARHNPQQQQQQQQQHLRSG
jgi:hypothetical protein